MIKSGQPWIFSPRFDTAFILAPAIIITALVVMFYEQLSYVDGVPPWMWLFLIVGVDVSHVYSTLFRTYFDKNELRSRQNLYVLTPLLGWLTGCLLYSIDSMVFWRALAYLAVFHFVRQQYGLMMIYGRKDCNPVCNSKHIDKAAIYAATLFPLIYWHGHRRNFDWFIKGDFITLQIPWLIGITAIFYILIMLAYCLKEYLVFKRSGFINLPKNAILFGTAISWFVGIVAFNNDLAFTATNVIAHGIPYMALIWGYGYNQSQIQNNAANSFILPQIKAIFKWYAAPLFIAFLSFLAFIEEGVWDVFVWQEHHQFFGFSEMSSETMLSAHTLTWLVPLLALPQITHYILDAYIWRLKLSDTNWKEILFYQTAGKP